ncbi:MAG: sulfite exporter TauE/SafE family protein [Parvularculaceae bacterium]
MLLIAVLAAGFAAGFAGGLFGIGGGIVTVPALYAVFTALGAGEDPSLKAAIGTSLSIIIVTSLRALMTHHAAGHVDLKLLRAWAPWIAAGAAAGGLASKAVPAEFLSIVFAGGAFYVAFHRLFGRGRSGRGFASDLTEKSVHIPVGLGTGLFSSLMGLGGGAVGVLVMTWSGRSIHRAIATASGFGMAVAIPGATGFIIAGFGHADLPPGSFGFVNLPAFIVMAAMTAIAAPLGARLAHRVEGALLSKLFGAYAGLAALAILWDVFAG